MNSQEFKVSKLSFQALRNDQTQVEWTEHVNQSPSAEKAPYFPVPVRGAAWTLDDLAKATSAATQLSRSKRSRRLWRLDKLKNHTA